MPPKRNLFRPAILAEAAQIRNQIRRATDQPEETCVSWTGFSESALNLFILKVISQSYEA